LDWLSALSADAADWHLGYQKPTSKTSNANVAQLQDAQFECRGKRPHATRQEARIVETAGEPSVRRGERSRIMHGSNDDSKPHDTEIVSQQIGNHEVRKL
jgi:hypothetical protein